MSRHIYACFSVHIYNVKGFATIFVLNIINGINQLLRLALHKCQVSPLISRLKILNKLWFHICNLKCAVWKSNLTVCRAFIFQFLFQCAYSTFARKQETLCRRVFILRYCFSYAGSYSKRAQRLQEHWDGSPWVESSFNQVKWLLSVVK